MKVLHVLANSSPDVNGYAVRTQMLLQNQNKLEHIENIALTSPWYPDRDSMVKIHELNGVKYLRTLHPSRKKNSKISHKLVWLFTRKATITEVKGSTESKGKKFILFRIYDFFYFGVFKVGRAIRHLFRIGWKVVEEKILIQYFTKRIIEVAKEEKVDIIHAHTPYRVGLPALKAARKLNLPFVYEMRGMWEETAVANGRWMRNGPAYKRFQAHETRVLRKADAVICISETLRKEAISRGVLPAKITVVPNAIETAIFENEIISEALPGAVERLNTDSEPTVIGYIGSLREMEGVDLTADAVALLHNKGHNVRLFVLTGTNGQAELRQHCKLLGIEDITVIMGPVPHSEVSGFYDLIDLFVVSRPDTRVTRLVTPLKPFEAMAMKKPVIASRLPALEEIVQHDKTGFLFQPGQKEDLALTLERCLKDPHFCMQIGANAKQWVVENRTWERVVESTMTAYKQAGLEARS
ncbi:MAG: glycosyltransferase [Euryarchaeota archaeon]|nr:glycosyltransferase [Euryarchaeota archaeon]